MSYITVVCVQSIPILSLCHPYIPHYNLKNFSFTCYITIGIAKLGGPVLQWVSGYSALYIDQSLIPQAEVGLFMPFPLHHLGLPTTSIIAICRGNFSFINAICLLITSRWRTCITTCKENITCARCIYMCFHGLFPCSEQNFAWILLVFLLYSINVMHRISFSQSQLEICNFVWK